MLKNIDLELLKRTANDFFSIKELEEKIKNKKPLRIKYGVDVTAPFLHIGHAVNLWMMRHFQECGHKVIFLIGDFTTRIGDPTGKSQTRKIISPEEIKKNSEEFIKQVKKVLLDDPQVFEIRKNSEWYDEMSLSEFLSLTSMMTHARLIQRDMFQKRISENKEIFMHEMLYPVLQGYDSVMLKSDLTIVGNDQLFNELMGRFYQEKLGQDPQVIITTKITPGTDGKEKQSKSLGNYIALEDSPKDKFGKIMSLPDDLIYSYFEVYTTTPTEQIKNLKHEIESNNLNPMVAKKRLAEALVTRYHGKEIAQEEKNWFEKAFSSRQTPDDIPIIIIQKDTPTIDLLKKCMPNESKSFLIRLIKQGGVRLNDQKIHENEQPDFKDQDILKIGKRHWFKLKLK